MIFYVIEFQTNNGAGSAIVNTYTDEAQARQKYHQIMSFASVSEVEKHGAIILTEDLFEVKKEVAPRTVAQMAEVTEPVEEVSEPVEEVSEPVEGT